jgi:N-acylneuraminate cytidylyltransferase
MSEKHDLLVIITARGGSKGIPGKNIKLLAGRPLLHYAIDNARAVAEDKDICLTTDDKAIAAVAQAYGLSVPFLRPAELASDTAGSYEVLLHAINHYEKNGIVYKDVLLLQPTSPFRSDDQVKSALLQFRSQRPELLVSVKESASNPYYNLFEENDEGVLIKSKPSKFTRRQDLPKVYEYNGAIYITAVEIIKQRSFIEMNEIHKFVMDEESSHDLDTPLDWGAAMWLINRQKK